MQSPATVVADVHAKDPRLPGREALPTDGQLLDRSSDGCPVSMRAFVDRHAQRLYALAFALLGDRADGEDVVQETFMAAFAQWGKFEGRAAVRTWLARIAVRQAARRHRRRRPRAGLVPLAAAASPADPADRMAAADARMDVPTMLAALSRQHRQVIVLREMEGMSYHQIAATLKIPRGTVESRLFRARQTLRARFGEYQP